LYTSQLVINILLLNLGNNQPIGNIVIFSKRNSEARPLTRGKDAQAVTLTIM